MLLILHEVSGGFGLWGFVRFVRVFVQGLGGDIAGGWRAIGVKAAEEFLSVRFAGGFDGGA